MRRICVLGICLLAAFITKAQTNTGILQIQLDVSQLSGTCNLSGVDTVYLHSGLGWSNPDSVWETIVGDWGLDDGKGKMTFMGGTIYSICFNVVDYYTNEADPDSTHVGGVGFGPMPAGKTPYNIGCVFRKATCPISIATGKPECTEPQTGKDENCENIYILGINDPANMAVLDNGGNTFSAVTATYITACADSTTSGIGKIGSSITNVRTYPVPFNDLVWIEFAIADGQPSKAEVFDMVGQKVADLSQLIKPGLNKITWKGVGMNGQSVPGGIYTYKISNKNQIYTGKVIKQ